MVLFCNRDRCPFSNVTLAFFKPRVIRDFKRDFKRDPKWRLKEAEGKLEQLSKNPRYVLFREIFHINCVRQYKQE